MRNAIFKAETQPDHSGFIRTFALFITAFPAVDISSRRFSSTVTPSCATNGGRSSCKRGSAILFAFQRCGLRHLCLQPALKRNLCGIDGRRVLFVILVLVIGAGLIVNVILKDNFGRARPAGNRGIWRNRQFTPALRRQRAMQYQLLVLVRRRGRRILLTRPGAGAGQTTRDVPGGRRVGRCGVVLAHLLRRALLLGYRRLFLRDAARGGCSVFLPGLDELRAK